MERGRDAAGGIGSAGVMTDLELLALEIETQWELDERGRLLGTRELSPRPAPAMVVAAADEGHVAAFGAEVPDGLVADLEAVVGAVTWDADAVRGEGRMLYAPTTEPHGMPPQISRCRELLEGTIGPVEISSGPSYVIPPGVHPSPDPSPRAGRGDRFEMQIVRSEEDASEDFRARNPRRGGWSDEEWGLLIDGALGPWAMAVEGGEVVSICHCARLCEKGAEAGVWTDEDHRGRGLAAAVTAAWASRLEGSGRTLFYSTSAENVSSQRVAARLGLREIGWMWPASLAKLGGEPI
jgi:RimJ/RimL family protein N-acetyltransferase